MARHSRRISGLTNGRGCGESPRLPGATTLPFFIYGRGGGGGGGRAMTFWYLTHIILYVFDTKYINSVNYFFGFSDTRLRSDGEKHGARPASGYARIGYPGKGCARFSDGI
ncbi:hypothetical protein ES703_58522 [subsurface metagenome]